MCVYVYTWSVTEVRRLRLMVMYHTNGATVTDEWKLSHSALRRAGVMRSRCVARVGGNRNNDGDANADTFRRELRDDEEVKSRERSGGQAPRMQPDKSGRSCIATDALRGKG